MGELFIHMADKLRSQRIQVGDTVQLRCYSCDGVSNQFNYNVRQVVVKNPKGELAYPVFFADNIYNGDGLAYKYISIELLPDNTILSESGFYTDEWYLVSKNIDNSVPWDEISISDKRIDKFKFFVSKPVSFVSGAPTIQSCNFSAVPTTFSIGSKSYMKVTAKPSDSVAHKDILYYYGVISKSTVKYEIHRVVPPGCNSRWIADGEVEFLEGSNAAIMIDTTSSPMNVSATYFIILSLCTEDGQIIRTPKIAFNVFDDIERGILLNQYNKYKY